MFRRILIALNILMLATACALPVSQNHKFYGAMEKYEIAYREIVKNDPNIDTNLETMADVLKTIDRRYVDKVDPNDLIDQAILGLRAPNEQSIEDIDPTTRALDAMFASLDRYTGYMSPTSFSNYRERLAGRFVGLGIHIKMQDQVLHVVSLLKGSGAEAAGLQDNDKITHVNGTSIEGVSLGKARTALKGPSGSTAVLTILRENHASPLQISVTRSPIEIAAVEHHIDGDIGYIRIFSFNAKTAPGVAEALASFEEDLGPQLCGVVLDMRNNPGGLVSAAEAVASSFLDGGNIYAVKNRGRNTMARDADSGDRVRGAPIVVMMNKRSASSSEIVAGALQYQNRAKLFGETSYGKGLMQTLLPLENGGGIRLTTGRFTTGGGPTFHDIGLKPDIPDTQAEGEADKQQIDRAARSLNCSPTLTTAHVMAQ
ncbi:MAG: S41 family peptidase [Sneathiella sp.]